MSNNLEGEIKISPLALFS